MEGTDYAYFASGRALPRLGWALMRAKLGFALLRRDIVEIFWVEVVDPITCRDPHIAHATARITGRFSAFARFS